MAAATCCISTWTSSPGRGSEPLKLKLCRRRRDRSFLSRTPGMTMSNLVSRLDPEQFMRVHRSHIVTLDRFVALRTDARSVVLAGNREIPVSKNHWELLRHGRHSPESMKLGWTVDTWHYLNRNQKICFNVAYGMYRVTEKANGLVWAFTASLDSGWS